MSTKVEILGNAITFFPENTIEAYGLKVLLDSIQCKSSDPTIISKNFDVCMDRILQEED